MTLDSENHALKKPAELVWFDFDKEGKNPLLGWIADLTDAMTKNHGVGIAGPQLGINYRIAIVSRPDKSSLVLLNPEIISKSSPFQNVEGCLSAPGKLVKVLRYKHVVIRNHDLNGKPYIFRSANKKLSACILHEMDHLDGIMCIDKGKKYDIQSALRNLS